MIPKEKQSSPLPFIVHKKSQAPSQLKIHPVWVCVCVWVHEFEKKQHKASRLQIFHATPRYIRTHMERSVHTQQRLPSVHSPSSMATSTYARAEEVKHTSWDKASRLIAFGIINRYVGPGQNECRAVSDVLKIFYMDHCWVKSLNGALGNCKLSISSIGYIWFIKVLDIPYHRPVKRW